MTGVDPKAHNDYGYMTMNTNAKHIPAGRFKAQCLALLDEVAQTGASLVVTKRGKPVAKVVPVGRQQTRSLHGSVVRQGDIVSPIDAHWDADS